MAVPEVDGAGSGEFGAGGREGWGDGAGAGQEKVAADFVEGLAFLARLPGRGGRFGGAGGDIGVVVVLVIEAAGPGEGPFGKQKESKEDDGHGGTQEFLKRIHRVDDTGLWRLVKCAVVDFSLACVSEFLVVSNPL